MFLAFPEPTAQSLPSRCLFRFAAMLRILAGFGEIGIQSLVCRIQTPVRQLSFQARVARLFRRFLFQCAFITVLIFVGHTPSHLDLAGCTKFTNRLQRIADYFLKEEQYSDFAARVRPILGRNWGGL